MRLSPRALSSKAAVCSRPPTQDKQKTEKSGRLLLVVNSKEKCFTFSCFLLATFEAGGTPTAAAGIKDKREPFRLTGLALRPAA